MHDPFPGIAGAFSLPSQVKCPHRVAGRAGVKLPLETTTGSERGGGSGPHTSLPSQEVALIPGLASSVKSLACTLLLGKEGLWTNLFNACISK